MPPGQWDWVKFRVTSYRNLKSHGIVAARTERWSARPTAATRPFCRDRIYARPKNPHADHSSAGQSRKRVRGHVSRPLATARSPYRNAIDPRYFFQSLTHEEAIARLQFLVDGNHRAGLLLGDAGSGKSLLLEVLAAQLRLHGMAVAKISLLGLDREELLASLAGCWGIDAGRNMRTAELWRLLLDQIAARHIEMQRSILFFDDCDEATPEVLCQVLRLAQTDVATHPAATMILAARRERVAKLGDRLLELADLRVDLMPWNADDTQHYLEHGLRSGRARADIHARGHCTAGRIVARHSAQCRAIGRSVVDRGGRARALGSRRRTRSKPSIRNWA